MFTGIVKYLAEVKSAEMVQDYLRLEVFCPSLENLCLGSSISINGAEAVKIKHLPPTLTAKYNFKNSTGFTPYVGVGVTAFIPWDEEGVEKVKEDYGYAAQVGMNFQPADAKNWGVFLDVRYADLNPEVTVNSNTKFKLDIDPVIYTLGYKYQLKSKHVFITKTL